MTYWILVLLSIAGFQGTATILKGPTSVRLDINSQASIQETGDMYVSLGMDSNLIRNRWESFNFTSKRLMTLAKTLAPAYLRLCGTDGDRMFFNKTFPDERTNPPEQDIRDGGLFPATNFSMSVSDWDNINQFVAEAGWRLIFGFNVQIRQWPQNSWNSSNAEELLDYSVKQGYYKHLDFELGNEPDLKSAKTWVNIDGTTLGKDFITLNKLLHGQKYGQFFNASIILGPDIAVPVKENFTLEFLNVAGGVISGVTWHNYYGRGELKYVSNYTDPVLLDTFYTPLKASLDAISKSIYPNLRSWIGETSSTCAPPGSDIDISYAATFMRLDKMGIAAAGGVETFVYQTFYGFWFGLVDHALYPTPNFWITLLYKRLVGTSVLRTTVSSDDSDVNLRATRFYSHCTPPGGMYAGGAVTLYGMNLLDVDLKVNLPQTYHIDKYLLSPGDAYLTSRFISLNGNLLFMPDEETLPELPPNQTVSSFILLPPKTLGFFVLKNARAAACMKRK